MEMPTMTVDHRAARESLRAEIAMRVLLSWEPRVATTQSQRDNASRWAVEWADALLGALDAPGQAVASAPANSDGGRAEE